MDTLFPAGRTRSWWLAAFAVGLVVLAPLAVVDVPPLLDYPNHLARMLVLASGGRDPVLARMYAPHWALIPNLAIDLLVPPLLHVLPLYVAGRLLLGLVLLLPLCGVAAYHRALFGEWRFWPLAAGLVACNGLFLLGFLNFLLSLGIALLVGSVWVRWREPRPLRAVLCVAAGSVVVFFCHLGGVLFLGVLLLAQEAEALARDRGRNLVRRASLLALALLPPVLLLLRSGFRASSSTVRWPSIKDRLFRLFDPVLNYSLVLDALTAALVLGFVLFCVRTGRLRAPPRTRIAFGLLLLFYLLTPYAAKNGAWLDARYPVMAGLLLFAGTAPERLPARLAGAAALGFAALLLVRMGTVAAVWHGHEADLRSLRASIAPVQPGDRVLVVRAAPKLNRVFWHTRVPRSRQVEHMTATEFHTAALLLIERRAFWPLLFTERSQQPLEVRPPFRALSFPSGSPPDFRTLRPGGATAKVLAEAPYLADWPDRFDEVLLLDADAVPDPANLLPKRLEMVNDTGFAALFRIRKPVRPADLSAR